MQRFWYCTAILVFGVAVCVLAPSLRAETIIINEDGNSKVNVPGALNGIVFLCQFARTFDRNGNPVGCAPSSVSSFGNSGVSDFVVFNKGLAQMCSDPGEGEDTPCSSQGLKVAPPVLCEGPEVIVNGTPVCAGAVDGVEMTSYTPLVGQPGFVPGQNVAYQIFSDVPEPGTFFLLGWGSMLLAGRLRRRLAAA
jgi:hypothetical protein